MGFFSRMRIIGWLVAASAFLNLAMCRERPTLRHSRGLATALHTENVVTFVEAATRIRRALPEEYPHLAFGIITDEASRLLRQKAPWVTVIAMRVTMREAVAYALKRWDTVMYVDESVFLLKDFGSVDPLGMRVGYASTGDSVLLRGLGFNDTLPDPALFVTSVVPPDVDAPLFQDAVALGMLKGVQFEASYAHFATQTLVVKGARASMQTQSSRDFFLSAMRRPGDDRLKPQADVMMRAVTAHSDTFTSDLVSLGLWEKWTANDTLAISHVTLLQFVEKFGVVCDDTYHIDQILLLPRACCCHLNLAKDDDLARQRDLDLAASLAATAMLAVHAYKAAKNQRATSLTEARGLLRFWGDRHPTPEECDDLKEQQAAARQAAVDRACGPLLEPCRAIVETHDCPRGASSTSWWPPA